MASAVGGVGSSNVIAKNQQAQIDGAPVGRPIPNMPAISETTAPLQSYGATGTAIFGGIITSEEYNSDFYWKDAIKIYEQMSRSDGQIAAIMYMLELPIRRATWSIEPASDSPKDKEIASFVQSCLFTDLHFTTATGRKLSQKWDDVLRHILMAMRFGFMPLEVCYHKEDGWVKWSRFIPLLPRTVWRWWVGEDNELAGIQQWTFKDYNYTFIDIPADKLLLFVHRQEGNNYEGVSLLRAAYPHWWYKTQFYKIEAIGIERNAIVPPVVHLPENASSADVTAAQLIGQNIRANEQLSVTLPFGWDLEYPKNAQKYAAQVMPSIEHHDVMIARSVLAQFINLGSTETGAYNLNASQMAAFLASLQAEAKYIEDVFNNDAIQRLVDYNYDGVEVYPTLKCGKISAMDFDILATALNKLVNMPTPLITPGPELEDYLREEVGVPAAPRSSVNNTNPTAVSTPERPETNPADHSDQESKSVSGAKTNPNSDIDMSIADGDASGTLQAMSEVRLLREAMQTIAHMDAVDHGLKHLSEVAHSRKLADKTPAAVEMCSCDPNTPAQQCSCDAGCECRAEGGSCPPASEQTDAHALSMQFEADIAMMERDLAEMRVEYHLALREEAESIKLFNPNHDAKGRFAVGAGGQRTTRGALTKSKGYESRIAKQEAKLQAAKDAYAAHVASTGAELTNEEKAAARGGSAAQKQEATPARPEPVRELPWNEKQYMDSIYHGIPAQSYLARYGREGMRTILTHYSSMHALRQTAGALGISGGRSKAELAGKIMGAMSNTSEDEAFAWVKSGKMIGK